MEKFFIEASKSTPYISLDPTGNLLEIKGESYPENVATFYNPIFEWLESFLAQVNSDVTVNLELRYLNTSSSKAFMRIFDLFDDYAQKGKSITINWFYNAENEMAKDTGEEFAEDLDLPFNILELS